MCLEPRPDMASTDENARKKISVANQDMVDDRFAIKYIIKRRCQESPVPAQGRVENISPASSESRHLVDLRRPSAAYTGLVTDL